MPRCYRRRRHHDAGVRLQRQVAACVQKDLLLTVPTAHLSDHGAIAWWQMCMRQSMAALLGERVAAEAEALKAQVLTPPRSTGCAAAHAIGSWSPTRTVRATVINPGLLLTAEMSGSRSVNGAVVGPSAQPERARSPTDCTGASFGGARPPSVQASTCVASAAGWLRWGRGCLGRD